MAQRPKLPRWTREQLDSITGEYTDAQIAELFGKEHPTRAAVAKVRAGFDPPVRSYREKNIERKGRPLGLHLPWQVAATDLGHELHLALMLYIRGELLGDPLPAAERRRLDLWIADMNDYQGEDGYRGPVVVAYDREKGFRLVKARPDDWPFMRAS